MYFNIVVVNCDDRQIEYQWERASDFMEAVENPEALAEDALLMLDDRLVTVDYLGNDEVHWNESDLFNRGLSTVNDLYEWLYGDDCDWFD